MLSDKVKGILLKLHEKTVAGTQPWQETTGDNAFITSFPRYTLEIRKEYNPQAAAYDFFLTIYNSEGKIVEEFSDNELMRKFPNEGLYLVFKEVYEGARSSALGVTEALDSILEELGG